MRETNAYLLAATALVLVGGLVAALRSIRNHPCPGFSEPLPNVSVADRVWSLPVVETPREIESQVEKSYFVSYPQSGKNVFDLGPFRLIESWQQSGNDAHTLGPRHVKLRVEPREGEWLDLEPFIDFPEYFPTPAELRADRQQGVYVVVFAHAEHATKKGELLPPRDPPEQEPLMQNQRSRALVYRVRFHAAPHRRLEHQIPLALATGAIAVGILAIFRRATLVGLLAIVVAAGFVSFALFAPIR